MGEGVYPCVMLLFHLKRLQSSFHPMPRYRGSTNTFGVVIVPGAYSLCHNYVMTEDAIQGIIVFMSV